MWAVLYVNLHVGTQNATPADVYFGSGWVPERWVVGGTDTSPFRLSLASQIFARRRLHPASERAPELNPRADNSASPGTGPGVGHGAPRAASFPGSPPQPGPPYGRARRPSRPRQSPSRPRQVHTGGAGAGAGGQPQVPSHRGRAEPELAQRPGSPRAASRRVPPFGGRFALCFRPVRKRTRQTRAKHRDKPRRGASSPDPLCLPPVHGERLSGSPARCALPPAAARTRGAVC